MFFSLSEFEREQLSLPSEFWTESLSTAKADEIFRDTMREIQLWRIRNKRKGAKPLPPFAVTGLGGLLGLADPNHLPEPDNIEIAFQLWLTKHPKFNEILVGHGLFETFAVLLAREWKTVPVWSLNRANHLLVSGLIYEARRARQLAPAVVGAALERAKRKKQQEMAREMSRQSRTQRAIFRRERLRHRAMEIVAASHKPIDRIALIAQLRMEGYNRLDGRDKTPLTDSGIARALSGIK